MPRKRIKKEPKSDSDESFDEEEAKKIYSKKAYEPGLPTDLETIFEQAHSGVQEEHDVPAAGRGRRKCFTEASNQMTRVPRRLETKYWVEDKEKDKRRKSMVAKLLKGRKKMKFRGLTSEQEENFHAILDNLDIDTMSPIKCDKLSSDNLDTTIELLSESSVRNTEVTTAATPASCLKESTLLKEDKEASSKTDLKLFSESFEGLEWAPLPKTPVVNKEKEKNPGKSRRESRKSIRRASSLFKSIKTRNTPENMLVGSESIASSLVADVPEIELAKQIRGADSIFGPIGFNDEEQNSKQLESEERISNIQTKENVKPRSGKCSLQTFSRRSSLQTTQKFKVRRSSRFFRQNNTEAIVGAIYQELTYTVRKKESCLPESESGLASIENELLSGQPT